MPPKAALSFWFIVTLSLACATPLRGDEVVFNNGDKLTGTITTMAVGQLTITGTVVGEVTPDLSNVKPLSTHTPVEMHTSDGPTIRDKVSSGADAGQISAASRAMPLAQLYSINPKKDETDE